MNMHQIKAQISAKTGTPIVALNMVRQFEDDAKTVSTPWLSHWDNDARIRVTMHEDVLNLLKTDADSNGLALKYEEVQPADESKSPYKRFVIITPKHIEASF